MTTTTVEKPWLDPYVVEKVAYAEALTDSQIHDIVAIIQADGAR